MVATVHAFPRLLDTHALQLQRAFGLQATSMCLANLHLILMVAKRQHLRDNTFQALLL